MISVKEKINYVILDFDGTLCNSVEVFTDLYQDVAQKFHLSEDYFATSRNDMRSEDIVRELGIAWWQLPRVLKAGRQAMWDRRDELRFFPEWKEVLLEISRYPGFAVLTSNSQRVVEYVFQREGLKPPPVQGATRFFGKGYRLKSAIKSQNVRASELLYVGDETRDIEAAQQAGIKSAAVSWGYNSEKALLGMNPDYFFESPKDLLEVITRRIPNQSKSA